MNTYADLKTEFAHLYEQTEAPTVDVEVRNMFIQRACSAITKRYLWSWREYAGSGVADGTSVFSLATDCDSAGIVTDTFYVGGSLFTQINNDERGEYGESSKVFYFTGNQRDGYEVNFPCVVPDNGASIAYRYYRTHPLLVNDYDVSLVPLSDAVANLAVGMFFKSEGEGEEAYTWLQDAENKIEEMKLEDVKTRPMRRTRKTTRRNAGAWDVKQAY